MQKSILILLVVLLTACLPQNQNPTFNGFWEGPHPENTNKKFYIQIDNSKENLSLTGYWTENNFYQSQFEVDSISINDDKIKFHVPMWKCIYTGKLEENKIIRGGFDCKGEAFDSVQLVKNNSIENYLSNPKPNSNLPNYEYVYSIPENRDDGIICSKPESSKDSTFISQLLSEIIQKEYGRMNSFILFKNNKLICEEYFYGYTQNNLHQIESCTKSITSLLIGIALDKGLITNINENIYEIFEEYPHLKNDDYKNITIAQLLTMTAGFEVQEEYLRQSPNRIEFALSRKMLFKSGTTFQYDGGCTEILGAILYRKTGMFPDDFAKRYLFSPLRINSLTWDGFQQERFPIMSGSLSLIPRDMLKIGGLVLNKGEFNNQQIVSKQWINESTSFKTKSHIDGDDYGYQWWNLNLNSNGKNYNVIWANGWGSQFIYIIPEINVVIVTTGHNYEYDSWAITEGIRKHLYFLDSK